jgi:hypothetical protein
MVNKSVILRRLQRRVVPGFSGFDGKLEPLMSRTGLVSWDQGGRNPVTLSDAALRITRGARVVLQKQKAGWE